MADDWQNAGFGLYVHWPFCQAKCPYCDFNSHVVRAVDHAHWQRALLAELDRVAALTPGRRLASVFFGGGTPSLMPPALVAAILDRAAARWQIADDIEITLEANPTSVEAARFRGYRAAGVNRVSIGVQALNDADLRRLGRLHDAAEARAAITLAREIFPRASFDLIYARQDQGLAAWRAELAEALALGVGHLSLYQLTIEPGTAFGRLHDAGSLRGLPDEDLSADLYALTQEMTAAAGYRGYETSNHALNGLESKHNLIYWRYGDYAGIGPGAHGRLTLGGHRVATEAFAAPAIWLDKVAREGTGDQVQRPLPGDEQALEYLMMALRLDEGVDLARVAALGESGVTEAKIDALVAEGVLQRSGGDHMALTARGRPLLNAILARLV